MKTLITLLLFATVLNAQTISKQIINTTGNSTVSGNIKLSHSVGETVTGTFTDNNGLIQISNGYFPGLLQNELSLSSFSNLDLKIYPNPTSSKFYFLSDSLEKFELSLFDLSGKVLMRKKLNINNSVDMTPYQAGIYVLRIKYENGNEEFIHQLIKI
ncbi:MAG: T9SS type A sorting domain-containing protein [Nonlabens sp.]|uniref:T9SS type A sorting domain-containing protein n=1 Tax=Nonlabens sp. TaxID=1888209 RepID=UPI003EF1E8D8